MESLGLRLGERLLLYIDIVHIVNLLIEYLNKPSPIKKKIGQIGPGKPKLAIKKLGSHAKNVCVCVLAVFTSMVEVTGSSKREEKNACMISSGLTSGNFIAVCLVCCNC